ncbi:LTA synthase family protein [uncultured Clostridium sp.]|uniref:LTA synthase family protein n=1 Tax=uncultured Clostridium sp. TaxID=59620 RepID=UPI002619C6B3|nr:sulfatase-like hydrolase/transferase [uncultured Clostridium sp.]
MNFFSIENENKIRNRIIYWAGLSFVLNILIEIIARDDIGSFGEFLDERFSLLFLNYAIVLVIMLPIIIFSKTISASIFSGSILIVLAIVGRVLNAKRGVPFTGADIYSIEYGIDMVMKYFSKLTLIFACVSIIGLIGAYIYLCFKEKSKKVFNIWIKIAISAFACLFLVSAYGENKDRISNQLWNINYAYKRNGYLFSFLDSFASLKMKKPDGYNKKFIEDVSIDTKVSSQVSKSPENIILIQLESFIDPSEIEGIELIKDPIPFISSIKEKSVASGKMGVPTFGAGTVRTEFEILTGYNIDFLGTGEVPNNSILKMKPVESLGQILRREDYEATMIHNYIGNFYHRDMVYANYGFDRFVSKEYMSQLKYNGGYPEDIWNLPIIDNLIQKEGKQFIFNVAVESHGPYKPVEGQTEYIKGGSLTDEDKAEFDYFLNRLNKVDLYVSELVKYVESLDEDTMILFYSDHLPSINVFNSNILVDDKEKYTTEYFTYSNYESKKEENEDLESYEISTKLLDIAGINSGIMPNFHRSYSANENYEKIFKSVQYDQLYGENYLGSDYERTDIQLGVSDIKLDKVESVGDKLIVKGENFTSSSRLIINDKEYEINYKDKNEFSVNSEILEGGKYKVIQKGMNGKTLSSSNEILK